MTRPVLFQQLDSLPLIGSVARSAILSHLRIAVVAVFLAGIGFYSSANSQETEPASVPAVDLDPLSEGGVSGEVKLSMNFNGTPWTDVLEWFVDETGMSLQKDAWPTGTFSYVDTNRLYSVSDALDAMNLVLMREGYTLIRRNQMLLLVDLEDKVAVDFLREIAEPVSPSELDLRANSDYVRTTFSLGTLTAEEAVDDLEKLRSPAGSVQVLGAARKVVAADTVGVLKSMRSVLQPDDDDSGPVLEIQLQHRGADEILELARPHLGLEPGVDKGEDVSLSMNLLGDRIYATGDPIKLNLLKGIVKRSDVPLPVTGDGENMNVETPVLRSYNITGADPTIAFEIVTRLLAGMPDVRMTLDASTKQIYALARPTDHATIDSALNELSGQDTQTEVFQLRRTDPVTVLQSVKQYFGSTAENAVGPTVFGDSASKKVVAKGTSSEIAEVKRLIEMLEGGTTGGLLGDKVRILPYTGTSAQDALKQLEMLWNLDGRQNRIRIITPGSSEGSGGLPERRLHAPRVTPPDDFETRRSNDANGRPVGGSRGVESGPAQQQTKPRMQELDADDFSNASRISSASRLVSQQGTSPSDASPSDLPLANESPANRQAVGDNSQQEPQAKAGADAVGQVDRNGTNNGPADGSVEDNANQKAATSVGLGSDIVIQLTPQGLIVASDDTEALAEFEELLAMISDSMTTTEQRPTVYWLKYIEASVASELLNSILSGSGSSSGGGVGDMAGSMLGELGGGMLGGLLGFGGGGGGGSSSGPVLTTTGSVSIVPDSRLNALIIQANPVDLMMVESVLEVIDREESPEDVRTRPKPQLIPVIYLDANEVATIVKGVYSERIEGAQGQNRQPSPQDLMNMLRGGRGGRGGAQAEENKPIPISISVETRSNALIVAAPPQDFEDIRELVETIDQGGMENEEEVIVRTLPGNVNASVVQNAVSAILGSQAKTNSTQSQTSTSSTSPGTPGADGGSSPSDIQQRIEMFRQMRERMGAGGGGGSTRGASPFGGFGGFGGGGFGRGSSGGDRSGGSRGGR